MNGWAHSITDQEYPATIIQPFLCLAMALERALPIYIWMAVSDNKYHLTLHSEYMAAYDLPAGCHHPHNQPTTGQSGKSQSLLPPLLSNGRLFTGTRAQCPPGMFSMLMNSFENTAAIDKVDVWGQTPSMWETLSPGLGVVVGGGGGKDKCNIRLTAVESENRPKYSKWVRLVIENEYLSLGLPMMSLPPKNKQTTKLKLQEGATKSQVQIYTVHGSVCHLQPGASSKESGHKPRQ